LCLLIKRCKRLQLVTPESNCFKTDYRLVCVFTLQSRNEQMSFDVKIRSIMNNLRNKVQLIGRVGNTPEVILLESGKKLVKFAMATNDSYKNEKGDKVEDTQWHNLIVWSKLVDVVEQYVNKGDEIAIEGKLTNRSYDDKEGNKRYVSEIVVKELMMLGGKK